MSDPRPLGTPRRALLVGGAAAMLLGGSAARDLAALEARGQGRLGVSALDVGTGRRLAHRADERFAMCSTFKALLAAAVLARVDAGTEQFDRRIAYDKADILPTSPVTEPGLSEGGLTVATLCQAIVEVSDNTAANLLLKTVGGPAGLTAYLRTLGDRTTRLDRLELALNSAIAGDPRDTSTPNAMVATLNQILLRQALSSGSRQQLIGWMTASATGLRRLRAHTPAGWRAADKTGTGANGATNDMAVFWPTVGGPILVVAYLTESKAEFPVREVVLADVGRLVFDAFSQGRR